MKKIVFSITICIAVLITAPLSALDNNGIEVTLRLYDQRIYYPETEIQVLIEISNNTGSTFRFKSAQDRRYNLDFQAHTLSNKPIKRSEQFIMATQRNQQVYYRDVDLEPGERFSFVEPLKNYLDISTPGAYILNALYFPELSTSNVSMKSNVISFTVRPSAGEMGIETRIDAETGEILRQQKFPPDEVVDYMLKARQKGEWNKFFLYLDVQSLYLQNPDTKRSFERSSEEERISMLDAYKKKLQVRSTGEEIVLVPISYEIRETRYTPLTGSVKVVEKFQNPDFIEVKEFTYYLNRRDGVWMIDSYDVRNLGSE